MELREILSNIDKAKLARGAAVIAAALLLAGGVVCTFVALYAGARIAPLREATGGPTRLAARRSPSA